MAKKNWGVTFLALGLLLASSALVGWLIWDLRHISLIEATEQHIRLADRGAAILSKDIEIDDLLMDTIRISLENPRVADLAKDAQHAALFDNIGNYGGIGEIMVTDATGRVVQSLNPHGTSHAGIAQRPYFKAHRDGGGLGLQISGPLTNPFTGAPMMVLTRRLQDRTGAFTGIILASVRISYLRTILSRIDVGPDRIVTVMRSDGHIIVQAPGQPASALGDAATDQALMTAAARMWSGTFIARSAAASGQEPVERLYAYRVLDNAPLVLSVGTAMSDVLAHWISTAWLIGIGTTSLYVMAIGLSLAINRELRRRRMAERQAQLSERHLRATIESIEDHAFFLLDRHGRVMAWNGGAQAMLGYTAGNIIGQMVDVLMVSPAVLQGEPKALAVSQAAGRWEAETECRRYDGTTFSTAMTLCAIVEPDDVPVGHAVIIHDLTNRNRLERRVRFMERMDAIGQVTSGVAHDFNNLLQAQIMSLELLQERMDPTSVERELSDVAVNAAEQAARLTDQLLAFSRQQRLHPTRVNLDELLVSVVSLAQHTVGPNIRLCPFVACTLPPISVDSAQLQTALLNLIINGRDAIAGSGVITLHAHPADPAADPPVGSMSATGFIILAVSDTGCGMDQATTERACEPFFSTKGAQGSGLGLSMVQGFARQSGGDIRITSMPNRGTSVQIWLPCVISAEETENGPMPRSRARAGHILLVDDTPDVLLVLAAFLRGAGFAVTQTGHAREALWHLRRDTDFTMMVSDFLMPGMNGMDLAHQARQSRPDLPVLMISGFAHSDSLSDLPAGFALLRKPFRKEDLLAAVSSLLPPTADAADETPASGSAGPPDAGAVVEGPSWHAPPTLPERPPKPTSA
ncbi:ATP-binding protein [Rhodopila sp.]|uniref:ATP-binding protein n=1 Tax=Rhodopila sp. TaxID=2480087 RepID=UPI003D096584